MRVSNLVAAALVTGATAYDVPSNLQQIYAKHKSSCSKVLAKGFTNGDSSQGKSFQYCGDLEGAIFIRSTGHGGQYTNMDIDCDGANRTGGKCANDPSGQGITAFQDQVAKFGIKDLDANIHPYVVFGNEDHSPRFDPRKQGMEPLSVMAVVCGGKLHYGIWGDTNGGTSTGEASISLADLCFPNENLDGDHGHDANDVLFIGFTGKDAVPGSKANWKAKNAKDFENSIKSIGDKLVAGLKA
ncbi:glycosyl hydrolase family 75 chitosanase csnB [Aspergillus clavatus NRRL 1]|uniref:glycosyl hydrolase family 75 chitosanase csnB n=1 Tax=Aspergillus clavatus (strain ATCC 1007 / CBS 513.65 / DSM 816 / NCTC 3887 / NRRL 1 / QM 1276 / 107) TaxID=344612 RepID=UPI0000EA49E7|nr:endo-chitosanase, pseudogene [Aspergillus clavatus NRRL 1]EAW11904.1 endo-chitosanase, pseudogene [Aspergillus clavatus NRRL 1]